MIVLLGEFSGNSPIKPELEANGWGRMWASFGPQWEYEGEPWGFDNGAFAAWRKAQSFPAEKFRGRIDRALSRCGDHHPSVAVIPDVVANGLATLAMADEWLPQLPTQWPWFLAVQDGMCIERARRVLQRDAVAGLFLGGSDDFKRTCPVWSEMAKRCGKKIHFARCNREKWVQMAIDCDVDSIDTARPVREYGYGTELGRRYFARFKQQVTGQCPQKLFDY